MEKISLKSLPIEIIELINNPITKLDTSKNITKTFIKNKLIEIKRYSFVNKEFNSIYKTTCDNLNIIYKLINKYTVYQREYEKQPIYSWDKYSYKNVPSPIIYDMILTGCDLPYANSTFKTWSYEIEEDLDNAIRLLPKSINYSVGFLRCRDNVSVLHAACFNENFPLNIIKLLLKNGINKKHKISLNGEHINILDDLEGNISSYRLSELQKFFDLYT